MSAVREGSRRCSPHSEEASPEGRRHQDERRRAPPRERPSRRDGQRGSQLSRKAPREPPDLPSPSSTQQDPPSREAPAGPPPGNEINLVINSTGHGTFCIATKGTHDTSAKSRRSQKRCDLPTNLTFNIQIDESSRRYLIHASMGRLDRIRDIHPGMNILLRLSYWNGLQRKRYGGNGRAARGGQLGIVARGRANLVMMMLAGEYGCRAWERDGRFQGELERFVEDALQFHLCLNGDKGAGGEAAGMEDGGGSHKASDGASDNAGKKGSAEKAEPALRRGRGKLLGKVLQKIRD